MSDREEVASLEIMEDVSSKPLEVDGGQIKQLVTDQGDVSEHSSETQENPINYAEARRDVFQVEEQRNGPVVPEKEDASLSFQAPPSEQRKEMQCVRKLGDLVTKGIATSPHFEVEIEDTLRHWAVLDLGADASIVSVALFEKIKGANPHIQLVENCAKLWDVSGNGLKVRGRSWIKFKLGDVEITHPVYVCESNTPLLVGADILWRIGGFIDLVNGVLWSGLSKPAPFPDDWKGIHTVQMVPQLCHLEVTDSVYVPPFTDAQRVRVKVAKSQDIGGKDATIKASSKNVEMGLDVVKKIWTWDPGGLNVKETDNTGKENDIPCVGVYRRH